MCSEKMTEERTAAHWPCHLNFTADIGIVLLFLVLPFHIFIMKILTFNLRFGSPRHFILFCLCLSDSLQVSVTAIIIVIKMTVDFHNRAHICINLVSTFIFNSTLTYTVSSLTLVALSVERYIACFHSYRIHEWLTNKRIIVSLAIFWILGVIGGGFACIPDFKETKQIVLAKSKSFGTIFISVTLPVSFVLIVIQTMLFCLSRKKLNSIRPPSVGSTNSDETQDRRRRQIKGAIVSSVIVLSYLICMLPGACLLIINRYGNGPTESNLPGLFAVALGMLNTLLNPFIYGFGMMDMREAMVKELKKIKKFLLAKLGLRHELQP